MKKSIQLKRSERGFTLLEVIITIVVFAILGSLLVTFMGTSITKSSVPVKQAQNLGISIGSMEALIASYKLYLPLSATWAGFKIACGPDLVTIGAGDIYSNKFETIQVTKTTGDQKIVSYFME